MPFSAVKVAAVKDRLMISWYFKVEFPTREQWQEGKISFPINSQVWYTDGFRRARTGKSGSRVYLEN